MRHVSRKHISDLNEQIQYYVRELLKKEGIVSMYEEETHNLVTENTELKNKVKELETTLQK